MSDRDVIEHARQKAREEAERRILQDRVNLEYELAEKRAQRAIWWQRNGGRIFRSVLFWIFILLISIPTAGAPIAVVLFWHVFKDALKKDRDMNRE